MTTARNVAIVLAIAAVFEFLPGGGDAANIVNTAISLAFLLVIAFGLSWAYRRYRLDIDGLPLVHRTLLYGAVGALVLAFAGSSRLTETTAGGLVFAALLVGAAVALVVVWRQYRSY